MNLFKENTCFTTELLFCLNGYGWDIVDLNADRQYDSIDLSFLKRFSNIYSHEVSFIENVISVAKLYRKIRSFLDENSTSSNELTFIICSIIEKVIKKSYLYDLVQFEFNTQTDSIFQFTVILKYEYLFKDILHVIHQINDSNRFVALFNLLMLFDSKYDISIDLECDPLYQSLCEWTSRGELPINYPSSFYISFNSTEKTYTVDLEKIPNFVDSELAIEVYNTGNLIRFIQSNGVKVNFIDPNLFWKFFQHKNEMYKVPVLMKSFVKEMKNFIFKDIFNSTNLKQNFVEYVNHLRLFYLHGSENFWTNFFDLYSQHDVDSDIRILFRNALYFSFDDSTAEFYNNLINVKEDQKKVNFFLKIHFRLPDLVKIIINEKSLTKYQCVFVHLQKIRSARRTLIELWKSRMHLNKQKSTHYQINEWFLLHCMIRSFNIFYFHCKMCIEHEMNQFHQFVHTTTEFDEIQKLHETCLLNLISNLFIKNTFILNLISRLISLSEQIRQCNVNIKELLKDYHQVINVFKQTLQINRKHATLFNELLSRI